MNFSDWHNLRFVEPEKLQLLYVAAALFFISIIIWLIKFILRPKRTHGSRYPFLGTMKFWFSLSVVLSLFIIAYARPFLNGQIVFSRGNAEVIFIVDYSASMFLKDTGWARIDIASREIMKSLSGGILKEGDRASILMFGKIFFPTLPLTKDLGMLATEADKIGRPATLLSNDLFWGSAIDTTFKRAREITDRQDMFAELHKESKNWRPKPKQNRLIIILSDGDFFNRNANDEKEFVESEKKNLKAELQELRRRNIPVYAVGIGTRSGARLTDILKDYKKGQEYDPALEKELSGQVSRLNMANLNSISAVTGGKSFSIEGLGSDASGFIKASIDRHRSIFVEPVSGNDRDELWPYFLLGALAVFVAGMGITKF